MKYITNAFSLNMVPRELLNSVVFQPIAAEEVPHDCYSAVGHATTAEIFSNVLNAPIAANRESITLSRGDSLYVGQYIGPRLEEGATSLPKGAKIEWTYVYFI